MNDSQQGSIRDFLKGLSARDFLRIGIDEIAYVRPLPGSIGQKQVFGVYAADGTQISVLESMDLAMTTLRHNDLLPVTLH